MGCFFGCFGSSNDQKRKRQRYKVIVRDQKPKTQNLLKDDASLGQHIIVRSSNSVPEPREKTEVPLSLKRRKKVTFDTNVTTYEHIEVYDSTESLLEKNKKGENYPKSDSDIKDDSVVLNRTNYRYGNCLESDDDFEDLYQEDYDLDGDDDDDDDDDLDDDEEHYDDDDDDDDGDDGCVVSVLNPVEHIAQWQALKSRGRAQKPLNFKGQKGNLSLNSIPLEPKNRNQETALDSSLSNWLISSEINTRNRKPIWQNLPYKKLERSVTPEFRGKFLD